MDINSRDNSYSINSSPSREFRAASLVVIDDTSSDSNPAPSTGPSRNMVVSSNVPTKKPNKIADSVENISSTLTENDVARLLGAANTSVSDYEFLIPSEGQRANRPPEGYISVYAKQITSGLRFPLHDMVVRVCNLMQVSPSQLVPNAHGMIVGFILCATFYGMPLTEGCFFSLFNVTSSVVKGFFQFSPIKGNNFLEYKPSSFGPWKKKFFFLRQKGNPWDCIIEWSESFSKPTPDASLAADAIGKGIRNHHFRVKELSTSKEILVHGGIEPGVPSAEYTFRYLMHNAAVTKFELLPEDLPPVKEAKTRFTAPTAAPNNPAASTVGAPSLAQPGSQSSPSHTKFPSSTDKHLREDLPDSSNDRIPLTDRIPLPISDETCPSSLPPHVLPALQTIESAYVARECCRKLEKDVRELTSELACTKSIVQELEQKLELSELKRAESETKTSQALEVLENIKKSVENLKLDSNRSFDKIMKEATEASSQFGPQGSSHL